MSSEFVMFNPNGGLALVNLSGCNLVCAFLNKAEAQCLKFRIDQLDSEPKSVRLGFYRDVFCNRTFSGDNRLLSKLIEP